MQSLNGFHMLILGAIFLLPPALVLLSPKARGFEKLGWALAALFLSWLGFAVFMAVQSRRRSSPTPG
ncbi:MAG TPA: hypothetical protein VHE32_04690 [Rhodanobacteraceae bacterium]|jgi:hypothetical protein|nr:hypothetical protein [Rhodanobacteraceae bacterium]